ncbi:tripartite motif-containing protein 16-like [Eucyclogobius newberryi]|uniref:tripartite motif-containing protein 16-like n=1 Tax=Eucyclogobius newberryi TaxID=166745 RepID=UPI003B59024C
MAESKLQLDFQAFSCPICLDLLNNPVTIGCGHSYCMKCIEGHWEWEEKNGLYSCPQCRQSFVPRPGLVKNTVLGILVEQLNKSGLVQSASSGHCPAEETDITCDICIGQRLKAIKSCLQCVASYCEVHLQSHYQSDALRKHQLTTPSANIKENICTDHCEVKKMFCRTDQELICVVCCMEQKHTGHCIVMAAKERDVRQAEVEARHHQIVQKIQKKETDLERIRKEELELNYKAEEAVGIMKECFTGLIHLVQEKMYDVEKRVWAYQKAEDATFQRLSDELELKLKKLRITQVELNSLAQTPDHNFFLHKYATLSNEIPTQHLPVPIMEMENPLQFSDRVAITVADLTDNLKLALTEGLAEISPAVHEQPTQPDPKTREDFLQYSCQITMDSYTAHSQISLSDGDRRATLMEEDQKYPKNPERFDYYWQVLSREDFIGRHYWELEWSGSMMDIALAYKSLKRKGSGDECVLGRNDKSWALCIDKAGYLFMFNKVQLRIPGQVSSKIGVYLDHAAGVLCIYSISDAMTLLHRVQTKFTEPLHMGLRFQWGLYFTKDTVRFLTLEQDRVGD